MMTIYYYYNILYSYLAISTNPKFAISSDRCDQLLRSHSRRSRSSPIQTKHVLDYKSIIIYNIEFAIVVTRHCCSPTYIYILAAAVCIDVGNWFVSIPIKLPPSPSKTSGGRYRIGLKALKTFTFARGTCTEYSLMRRDHRGWTARAIGMGRLSCVPITVRPSLATRALVPYCRVENYYTYIASPLSPDRYFAGISTPPPGCSGGCRDGHCSRICSCRYVTTI